MVKVYSVYRCVYPVLPVLFVCCVLWGCDTRRHDDASWPVVHAETRPWARWWWHGNAVTEAGITAELESYQRAGIGGLEITPIYGVYGYEDQFVEYLSPRWMQLFLYTLKEADRLGLGIDMATGTGWPFGGPWIGDADACKTMQHNVYTVAGGQRLTTAIAYIQEPLVRVVGNSLYTALAARDTVIPDGLRLGSDPKRLTIDSLRAPITANGYLQGLAPDQVKFRRPLVLKTLMAYSDRDSVLDLTNRVDSLGMLDWTAPPGTWKLYAVFSGWHGKMVERAGPGGEGNVIDHFSAQALRHYLARFDSAFAGHDIGSLRAFFNDSYEVDDARGAADWTPLLFEEFRKRRGYDLRQHLPALFGEATAEMNARVLCDYRETISDMVLANFTKPWRVWAYGKAAMVRNQAHGAPSNILDLYGEVDIPEIEGEEPLRIKMASSAGHVTGKRLVSSESATWLNEHFESDLGDIKGAVDRFLLHGVNHVFYHGTCYSPPGEPWPGWLFYAAVHVNPRNPQWHDMAALNAYITRNQSFLQQSVPDQDVLLYFPVYDRFSAPGSAMIEHFDGVDYRHQFDSTAFKQAAEEMLAQGYGYDYVSDKQVGRITAVDYALQTSGNSVYQVLVLPRVGYIPWQTFKKAAALAAAGATVVSYGGLPADVAGFGDLAVHRHSFDSLVARLQQPGRMLGNVREVRVGRGRWLVGDSLAELLSYTNARREVMVDRGVYCLRKRHMDDRALYFLVNQRETAFEGWLPVATVASSAVLYNAWTGVYGQTAVRHTTERQSEVYVQLGAGETLLLACYQKGVDADWYPFYLKAGDAHSVAGRWTIHFMAGGPSLPPDVLTDTLSSWTGYGAPYEVFSGTASYRLTFERPSDKAEAWELDLGRVYGSAEVLVNGRVIGTVVGPSYRVRIEKGLLHAGVNVLEIRVSNLMANRIADLDRRGVLWKKFYNVNVAARKAENRKDGVFDASGWSVRASGLAGPVTLTALRRR